MSTAAKSLYGFLLHTTGGKCSEDRIATAKNKRLPGSSPPGIYYQEPTTPGSDQSHHQLADCPVYPGDAIK